jgi:hypothetical protein
LLLFTNIQECWTELSDKVERFVPGAGYPADNVGNAIDSAKVIDPNGGSDCAQGGSIVERGSMQ